MRVAFSHELIFRLRQNQQQILPFWGGGEKTITKPDHLIKAKHYVFQPVAHKWIDRVAGF